MNLMLRSCAIAIVMVSSACATNAAIDTAPQTAAPAVSRYEHSPDLASLVKPYLSAQGFLDPAFSEAVAKPSPYLTDFYGLQAIKDVPRDRIVNDFVPRFAKEVAQDEHSVTLRFSAGFDATFYPVSSIAVVGQKVPVSHVRISGESWPEVNARLAAFRTLVEKAKLADDYLVPNSFYADELATYRQMESGKRAPITLDPDGKAFAGSRNGVLLVPESVHGRPEDVQVAQKVIAEAPVDWIGLEMIGIEHQPTLDAFNAAKKGTPAYDAARAKLVDYFATAWNGRAGPKTTGEENLYFKLVEAAHDRGTKIIAIEGSTIEFLLLRYGETAFGGAVRSRGWANVLPKSGRGVIFGGSAHFNMAKPINVQDFVAAADPKRSFFSLKLIEAKTRA